MELFSLNFLAKSGNSGHDTVEIGLQLSPEENAPIMLSIIGKGDDEFETVVDLNRQQMLALKSFLSFGLELTGKDNR